MHITNNEIERAMQAVATSAQRYLHAVHRITCTAQPIISGKVDSLKLEDVTAIVGLGGVVCHLATVSFERPLLSHLMSLEMAGITTHEHEQTQYLHETAAEVSNIIVGNSLVHLEELFAADVRARRRIFMSPPVVIETPSRMHQALRSGYTSVPLMTDFGNLVVSLAWPYELFEKISQDSQQKEQST